MTDDELTAQVSGKDGFIAALDQSGGSTRGALRLYSIPESAYSGDPSPERGREAASSRGANARRSRDNIQSQLSRPDRQ